MFGLGLHRFRFVDLFHGFRDRLRVTGLDRLQQGLSGLVVRYLAVVALYSAISCDGYELDADNGQT